ncbi:GPW/gp25 family protein [Paenibacillus xanthanilyticus]|uniref:IraD/Gp25-like domain-containing protein n=1 Tax=Paenibacillus xanthanilyticus TaxID=1783531 RepID=A0ABV8KA59_9BACL
MTIRLVVEGHVPIDFGATGEEEILQCVRTIVSTVQGTVPLDRAFGIDGGVIDQPMTLAPALLAATIIQQVGLYEPRVTVKQVECRQGEVDGALVPIITLDLVSEVV